MQVAGAGAGVVVGADAGVVVGADAGVVVGVMGVMGVVAGDAMEFRVRNRKSGARTRSWLATSGREKAFNNRTNVFSGANELFTLSNGVYESKSEEKHILKTNVGLKRLLESLEKLDEKQEEVKDETET